MEKIAIVFPGQGSQFIGMGKSFYDKYPIARQTYEEASEAAHMDIAKLSFEGGVTKQCDFTNMQMIVVTTAVAMYRAFYEQYPVIPQFFAGHSVGEYAAYICSGGMELNDAMQILHKRGTLLQRSIDEQKGYMEVVEDITLAQLKDALLKCSQDQVYISCENSFLQNMVSASYDSMPKAEKYLKQIGARCTPLFMSPPIHSPLIEDGVVEDFRQYLTQFTYHAIHVPVISNLTGTCTTEKEDIPYLLSQQLCNPVRWSHITQEIDRYGTTLCIEMGPKKLLQKFDLESKRGYQSLCFGTEEERNTVMKLFETNQSLIRDRVDFTGRCLAIAVASKNYNYDNEDYSRRVVQSYNKIMAYQGKELDLKMQLAIVELLKELLNGKKIEEKEQKEYFHRLITETGMYYKLGLWYESAY